MVMESIAPFFLTEKKSPEFFLCPEDWIHRKCIDKKDVPFPPSLSSKKKKNNQERKKERKKKDEEDGGGQEKKKKRKKDEEAEEEEKCVCRIMPAIILERFD